MKERETAPDVIRIVALSCVIALHFFLHNGFYYEPVRGVAMYIMTMFRTLFMICIPLFLMLTGYLNSHKEMSASYYTGIGRVLLTYLYASIVCLVFKKYVMLRNITFLQAIKGIFGFSMDEYAWYIEMYVGLFLLIPFLNVLYRNLKTDGQKRLLLGTLICMTALPGVFNFFGVAEGITWTYPQEHDHLLQVLPDWWTYLYPVTYYYIGCYMREHKSRIGEEGKTALLILCWFVAGTLNYYVSYGKTFVWGGYQDYASLYCMIPAVLVFDLIRCSDLGWLSNRTKRGLAYVSGLCLGAYLISYPFDVLFYDSFNRVIRRVPDKWMYFPVMFARVLIYSLAASAMLQILTNGSMKLVGKLAGSVTGRMHKKALPDNEADGWKDTEEQEEIQ